MRILFLSTIFPHATAKVRGTFNLELCRALSLLHDVRIVSPRSFLEVWRTRFPRPDESEGDRWVPENFGLRVTYPTYFYMPKITRRFYGSYMWHSIQSELQWVLSDFTPDAIVSYWAHPEGEVALRLARQIGVPAVVKIGGSDVLMIAKSLARRAKVSRVLRESDGVVTVSEALRRNVIDLGAAPERVQTIYQGVDCELFDQGDAQLARRLLSLPCDRRLLLWVGRMVDVKGLNVLIAAVDQLRQRVPDVLLLLVGDGLLRQKVLDDVRRRGLDNHVRWVGAKGHSQLPDWYRASDMMVMSSWSEGLPNVLRESLSCGRPFVSTDVGSVREIADSRGGPPFAELVPIGDAAALANAIERTLHPSYLAAAQAVPRRSWNHSARELTNLLHRLRGEPEITSELLALPLKRAASPLVPQLALTTP